MNVAAKPNQKNENHGMPPSEGFMLYSAINFTQTLCRSNDIR